MQIGQSRCTFICSNLTWILLEVMQCTYNWGYHSSTLHNPQMDVHSKVVSKSTFPYIFCTNDSNWVGMDRVKGFQPTYFSNRDVFPLLQVATCSIMKSSEPICKGLRIPLYVLWGRGDISQVTKMCMTPLSFIAPLIGNIKMTTEGIKWDQWAAKNSMKQFLEMSFQLCIDSAHHV